MFMMLYNLFMATSKPDQKKSVYQNYLEQKHSRFNTPDLIIDSVVEAAVGLKPTSKEKVILGEVNEVYDIKVEGDNHYIVRISRSSNPRFLAEKWALDEVRKVEVSVPEVLLVTSQQVEEGNLTFCVETKLTGSPIKNIPLLEKDKMKKLVIQAGSVLAKIHSVKPTGFGELAEDGQGKLTSWTQYINKIEDERQDILESATKINLNIEDVNKGFMLLKKNQYHFENMTPHLLHGDFSTKHILMDNDLITGIIDFESCKSGDPIWDFAWWSYFFGKDVPVEWIKEGYIEVHKLDPEFDRKLVLYRIRLGLSMIHYYESEGNISGIKHTKEKFLSDLEQYDTLFE